jgi:Protein of unknown function (DUF3352)
VVEDAALAAGRAPAAIGRELWESWLDLSIYTRRRAALGAGLLAALLVLWLVAVPALPCQAPGGDTCPPGDDAIHLVPDDALAYVHLNVDPGTQQYEEAAKVASRVPRLADQATGRLLARLPGPNGAPDFAHDIQPWFGGQAAMAVVPTGGGVGQEVELLQASDEAAAQKFATSIAAGKTDSKAYRDVSVQVDRRGLATALVGGFLAIGNERGVREVIDVDTGAKGSGSLAGDQAASAARDALPAERLADAYLSKGGIAALVANSGGPLGTLASLISPDASQGVAAALVANDDGLEIEIRSELDADRAKAHPGFFSAFPAFKPTLAGSLPGGSLGYVGFGDPGKALTSLLKQARAEQPGLAAAVGDLLKQVKDLGDVDLEQDLLPSLGGEGAFALQPAPAGGNGRGDKGRAPTSSQIPFLEFVAGDVDTERASRAVARLQGPITQALNPTGLHAPSFTEHRVRGVTAHSVSISPTVDLTYAIAGSSLVIATNPAGVDQVVRGKGGLDGEDLFRQATAGFPGELSVLGYLNLGGVFALGEQSGLAEDPAYATFASEIHKLEALGLAIQSSSDQLSTDVRLLVKGAGGGSAGTGAAGAGPSD